MLRRRRGIPMVLCIDVEPDPREVDLGSPPPWAGLERSAELFTQWRAALAAATRKPAHFTWFVRMDPQIQESYGTAAWAVDEHRALFESFARAGDEIGLHVHMYRRDPERSAWIADHGNADWVSFCLDSSFAAFRDSFRRGCQSVRLGDGWTSDAALERLESLGARFDLTAEPESLPRPSLLPGELATGSLPGYVGIPRRPYHPSLADFHVADERRGRRLWIMPISAGTGEERRRDQPDVGDAATTEAPAPRAPWRTLNLTLEPRIFQTVVEHVLESERLPYLAFMVRTDFCLHAEELEAVERNVSFLLGSPHANRCAFATPAEALRLLGHRIRRAA